MPYVDGFVVPVPQQNLAAYKRLARKAGAVGRPAALGCWLYGVARRVAGKLRARSRADLTPPEDVPERSSASPADAVGGRELTALLDEELARLPERLRAPLVLCYLEGLTRDEAAAWLMAHAKAMTSEPLKSETGASGDLGYTWGKMTVTGADGKAVDGYYVRLWTLGDGNRWQLVADVQA